MEVYITSILVSGVMAALGDKIAANILAQTAKVPSIPWSGDGLTCQLTEDKIWDRTSTRKTWRKNEGKPEGTISQKKKNWATELL